LYFTEVLGFCCMGNHFHLLVRMLPETDFSDRQIMYRYERFWGENKQKTGKKRGQVHYVLAAHQKEKAPGGVIELYLMW